MLGDTANLYLAIGAASTVVCVVATLVSLLRDRRRHADHPHPTMPDGSVVELHEGMSKREIAELARRIARQVPHARSAAERRPGC